MFPKIGWKTVIVILFGLLMFFPNEQAQTPLDITDCIAATATMGVQPVDDQTKVEYLRRYAPQVWLHSKEQYWPSSVEWSFHFLKRYWSDSNGRWWFLTKEKLKTPSSVLDYFHGADPKKQWTNIPLKLEDVPAYAFWHDMRHMPDKAVDLVYFFYYPYNRGKEVANTVFGSHVGDWEHVTVRLTQQWDSQGRTLLAPLSNAESFGLAYHSEGKRYAWAKVPMVQDTEHPIVYSGHGSHGSYLEPGSHKYGSAAGKDLVDYMDAGMAWDTWKKLECFDYAAKRSLGPTWKDTWPKWLEKDTRDKNLGSQDPASGPVWRWGNYRMGSVWAPSNMKPWEKKFWKTNYEYRLVHGPTGPVDKDCFVTPELD